MIASIDPGASGAIAWLSPDGHLIEVLDMPIWEVRGKKRVCAAMLATIIRERLPSVVVVEGVNAMPGQGVSSCFAFGYAAGLCEGVASGAGVPVQIVSAAMWKRRAGVSSDKSAARMMAARLWPGAAQMFKRVKDDGRAEAALLGRWYAQTGGAL
jgi:crossover junction endodeoxyribonuclease RuvC